MARLSYGRALTRLVEAEGDALAVVDDVASITRHDLDRASNRLARSYADLGVAPGDFVTIALPNGIDFFLACLAVWKLGATPNPVSAEMPAAERAGIIERARPRLVVGVDPGELPEGDWDPDGREAIASLPAGTRPDDSVSDAPLPDRIAPHVRAMASGGSTGRPKLIVLKEPAEYDPENPSPLFKARRAVLVPGPLYHAAPFSSAWQGLLGGARIVVMARFDPARCLELIERHRVDRVFFVPTMMQRILRLPEAERTRRDLSSLDFVLTGGAPCPQWVMRAWIEWLGPDRLYEAYGPSERIGGTTISGREWLAHPGSVGRPLSGGRIRILDPDGRELPPGQMGEIFMLPAGGPGSTYRYVGATTQTRVDGWESVGDMGYLDDDGYLYLGDRRSDMILCGGRNIYPAEIEAAVEAHAAVRSCAVIGLPDDDLGQRIHAIVEVDRRNPVGDEELRAHLKSLLVGYKTPRSFEYVDRPLRDEAGKVRRAALRAARIESS